MRVSPHDIRYDDLAKQYQVRQVLKAMSWLAPTQDEALHGLSDLANDVVEDLHRNDEPTPEPLSVRATQENSTSESANDSTGNSSSRQPRNTSASTSASSANSATGPETKLPLLPQVVSLYCRELVDTLPATVSGCHESFW
nr:hypothetical protein [Ornithinimicrobium sp. HY1745]